ncbi:T9SS type A sorting domain-containing protein [Flavobacterium sp. CLA17]|nr:T9SS type A sorting domain-containing protein [Flavobacterium sp. CLA17]
MVSTSTQAVVSNIGNNSGSLVLTATNSCGEPSEFVYQIRRTFTSAITITPATSSCLTPAVASSFSIGPNASINGTSWTITPTPATGSFTIGINTPTTTATINTTANVTPGAYTLTATSISCGGSVSIPIFVRPSAPIFTTSTTTPVGTSQACVQRNGGSSVTYSVAPVTGATAYVWTFPSGWSPSTTTTATNTITITPNGNTASGNVTVQAVSGSGCNSTTAIFPVSYRAVAPGAISTNSCFNVGRSSAVSVTIPVANVPSPFFGSYTATLISTVAGSTTNYASGSAVFSAPNTVTFNTTNTATGTASPPPGTYNLILTHNAGCGSPAASTAYVVTINSPSPAPAITAQYNSNGGICDQFTLVNNPNGGGTGITWYVNGTVATNGGNVNIFLNTLTICGSTPATSVWADVTVTPASPGCPYIVRVFAVPGTHGLRQANSNSQKFTNDGISIYPNPSTGNFSIQVDHFKEAASATISDTTGKQIGSYNLKIGENRIENLNVTQGTYIILLTVDGKTESRKIIIK